MRGLNDNNNNNTWGTLCCRKIGQFRKRGFSYKKPFLPSSSGIYRNQGSRRKSVRADLRLNSHPFASVFWLSRPHPMIILGSVFVSGSHAFAGVFSTDPTGSKIMFVLPRSMKSTVLVRTGARAAQLLESCGSKHACMRQHTQCTISCTSSSLQTLQRSTYFTCRASIYAGIAG